MGLEPASLVLPLQRPRAVNIQLPLVFGLRDWDWDWDRSETTGKGLILSESASRFPACAFPTDSRPLQRQENPDKPLRQARAGNALPESSSEAIPWEQAEPGTLATLDPELPPAVHAANGAGVSDPPPAAAEGFRLHLPASEAAPEAAPEIVAAAEPSRAAPLGQTVEVTYFRAVPALPAAGSERELSTEQLVALVPLLRKKVKGLQQRRQRHRARLEALRSVVERLRRENRLSEEKLRLLEAACLRPERSDTVTVVCRAEERAPLYAAPEAVLRPEEP